ncbi:MAG: RluA family pseudouridine synthase [Clostridia bacterium]|nr:RluA family pseudouridine synthase [Clostridia bacterium]
MSETVYIDLAAAGERADRVLAEQLSVTRATVQKWMEQGLVTDQNGRLLSKNTRFVGGESVVVSPPDPVPCEAVAQDIPLDVVYEDDDLLVVNKPKGMVVHPAAGNPDGTLVNALLAHCGDSLSGIGGVTRPGIVHRIDKDTSGLLIVAKNDAAHQGLAEQIKEHSFTREYEAVIVGHLKEHSGTINAPIGRHPVDRKKMAITDKNSKNAVTHYTVLAEYAGYSHVRLRLETGRTHQIRVHMASLGQPVAGDAVYGGSRQPLQSIGLQGQCLHAKKIGFIHPVTNEYLEFDSALPPYFQKVLTHIAK